MKTLLLLSGGVDSTSALWDILSHSDDEVLVQHINTKCYLNSWRGEQQVVDKIISVLQEVRPFTVLPNLTYEAIGMPPVTYMNSVYAALTGVRYDCDRVVISKISSDGFDTNIRGTNTLKLFNIVKGDHKVILDHPHHSLEKRDWVKIGVPQELLDMTITCRLPVLVDGQWKNCGKCVQCYQWDVAKKGEPTPKLVMLYGIKFPYFFYKWPEHMMEYYYNPTVTNHNPKICLSGVRANMYMWDQNIPELQKLIKQDQEKVLIQPVYYNDNEYDLIIENDGCKVVEPMWLLNEEGWLDWQIEALRPFAYGANAFRYNKLINKIVSVGDFSERDEEIYALSTLYRRNRFWDRR